MAPDCAFCLAYYGSGCVPRTNRPRPASYSLCKIICLYCCLSVHYIFSRVDSRVVAWVRQFLLGRTQRVRVLFADDCIIYRKIMNDSDTEKLQIDLDRLGGWA
jgi:hypothetical protein